MKLVFFQLQFVRTGQAQYDFVEVLAFPGGCVGGGQLFCDGEELTGDMCYDVLTERVRFFKESKEGISIMRKVMDDKRNESLIEGGKKGMKAVALRMSEAGKYALWVHLFYQHNAEACRFYLCSTIFQST